MTRTTSTTAFLFTSISILPIVAAQSCSWKNGQKASNYFACDPTAAQSSCCLQGEACVANGLCYGSLGQIYRGACAGGWGNETACPEQCNDKGTDGGWANLFLCPTEFAPSGAQSWWCGDTSVVDPCDADGTSSNPTKAQSFSLPILGMLPAAIMPWSAQNFTGCAVSQTNEYSLVSQIANVTEGIDNNAQGNGSCTTITNPAGTEKDCPNSAQIGEGVAIGALALLLVGVTGWALWERRQKNQLVASSAAATDSQQVNHQYSQDQQQGDLNGYPDNQKSALITPHSTVLEMATSTGRRPMHEMYG